jgi:anti-anti-sigma regulatory factor
VPALLRAFGPSRILVLGPDSSLGPVGLSILNVFRRAWWPYDTVLGRVDGLEGYHDVHSYPNAKRLSGLVIYRFDGPLFFANAKTFRDEIRRLAKTDPPPLWIIIAAELVTDVDTTASDVLEELDETLNAQGISLVFAEVKGPVRRKIERYGLTRTIDPRHFSPHHRSRHHRIPRRNRRPIDCCRPALRPADRRRPDCPGPDGRRNRAAARHSRITTRRLGRGGICVMDSGTNIRDERLW